MSAGLAQSHRTMPPERTTIGSPRYPGKSDDEKAQLIRAEMLLISRFLREELQAVAWRCRVCGGRVDIRRNESNTGRAHVASTIGKCRTPGCLDWED